MTAIAARNESKHFALGVAADSFDFLFYMFANTQNVICKRLYILEHDGVYLLKDKFIVCAVRVFPRNGISIVYMTVFKSIEADCFSVNVKVCANFMYTFFCHFEIAFQNILFFIVCCTEHFDFVFIAVKIIRSFKDERQIAQCGVIYYAT